MSRSVGDWDFRSDHVQDLTVFTGSDYISSESIVVCAVPWVDSTSPSPNVSSWIPIGLLENATIQQNKQLAELFEIGSKKMFNIPGRTFKRLNLSRIMFNGPSLLKAATRFNLPYTDISATGVTRDATGTDGSTLDEPAAGIHNDVDTSYDPDTGGAHGAHLFIDIASHFFNVPTNLGFVFRDSENDYFGAFILEDVFVQSHQLTLSGQQVVVMENVSMTVGNLTPVKPTTTSTGA